MSQDKSPLLLLVEDNPDHATLILRTAKAEKVRNSFVVQTNAEHALAYLRAGPQPAPSAVFIDINLPEIRRPNSR